MPSRSAHLGTYVLERDPLDVDACAGRSRAHALHDDRGRRQRRVSFRPRGQRERARGEAGTGESTPGMRRNAVELGGGVAAMACDARKFAVCTLRQLVESCWIALRAVWATSHFMCGVTATSPLVPTLVTIFDHRFQGVQLIVVLAERT